MALLSSLLLMGLLLAPGQSLVSPEDLKQISVDGSKYINVEVENAVNGVKTMKTLMEKTGKDHQEIRENLEQTKRMKEEALRKAQESKKQLTERVEVCNDTMLALWEECKPCLKQTCMTFYSKTCSSGAGLVGRQLEEYLSHASPFSIWINEDKIDTLEEKDERQDQKLEDLEETYDLMEESVDSIFQDSIRVFGQMRPSFSFPFTGRFWEAFSEPVAFPELNFPFSATSRLRERSNFFQHGFQGSFQNLFRETQQMLNRAHQLMESQALLGTKQNSSTEKENATNDRMVCKELRRNSEGCLKMKDKCETCKAILAVDCSGEQSAQGTLQQQFEDSMRLAEKFTSQYEKLLHKFQEEMLNTTSLLDQLNQQYGWVSKLANLTDKINGIFQVTTLFSKSSDQEGPSNTTVTVQLFDSDPLTIMVPGDIRMNDPAFSGLVAQEALKQYKKEKGAIEV
ncbi:clusterin [Ambystoma mexicanum]|uniref:clusterin n=1 Tax=Ambystoma mexicanum TaxID=8296 RepID=UPI0037E8BFC1